eukprot:4439624-Alexandrium_andersonii.AAC.1
MGRSLGVPSVGCSPGLRSGAYAPRPARPLRGARALLQVEAAWVLFSGRGCQRLASAGSGEVGQ